MSQPTWARCAECGGWWPPAELIHYHGTPFGELHCHGCYERARTAAQERADQHESDRDRRHRTAALIAWTVLIIVVVVVYVSVHSARYSHCLNQPGLFAWPSVCV